MENKSTALRREHKIQTFVFVDLEATGLQYQDPRLVELSMIAVSREELLQLPRVLHKYTRLYHPWKPIVPRAEEMSGLSNASLEHLPGFTKASARAIALFLDLPKPLTLVAHNGNRYDFKLLKAELVKVDSAINFDHLLCTDTLTAIKDLDVLIEKEDIQNINRLAESFNMEDDMFDDVILTEDNCQPTYKKMCTDETRQIDNSYQTHTPTHPSFTLEIDNNYQPHTPTHPSFTLEIDNNFQPHRKVPVTPPTSTPRIPTPKTPHKLPHTHPQHPSFTPENDNDKLHPNNRRKRQINNAHRRLTFGGGYKAHRAESDCEALLQICGHYGLRFVEWADTFSERFNDVKPMWLRCEIMENSSQTSTRDVNQIQTFVFLDLEATGLPYDNPRILELSMIAVSRNDLIRMCPEKKSREIGRITGPSTATGGISLNQPSCNGELTQQQQQQRQQISNPKSPSSSLSPSPSSLPDSPKQSNNNNNNTTTNTTIPVLPRILHKYTRLYYPWKTITPKAEEITGLSNASLEHLPGFTKASARAISLFLDLPKPLTLVAHNGNRYDFKLLKAELVNVNAMEDFSELQCTDTLKAIPDIDKLYEKEDISEISRLAESFTMDDDMSDEIMDEHSPPTNNNTNTNNNNKRMCPNEAELLRLSPGARPQARANPESIPPQPQPPINYNYNHQGQPPVLEVVEVVPITPVKEQTSTTTTTTPNTPHKPTTRPPRGEPITPETTHGPLQTHNNNTNTNTNTNNNNKVRRSLNYDGPHNNNNNNKRKRKVNTPYKQVSIYNRLFQTDYKAHRAESDCEALLQICGHYGLRFVEWADTFSERFEEVRPMWFKRKSFTIP
ncbi:hypothetical protein Pmani_035727 [Petrolisthes manimaculis]|uniref:Exonuclease domain-containing protein n=1 Tax=Petrolisthes manimaculis TaxID=1843537 RepID=A0AAE1NLR7_9EUCA|nr:hypothetical protein Pmani_035727 [Petrolisthes manimaculis]